MAAAGRRGGYAGSLVVNIVMLVLVNGWPGWESVPFLTDRTVLVIGAVNAAIVARAIADLVNLVVDRPRPRALGDVVSIGFGFAALVQMWQVFPLDVIGTAWEVVARVLLAVGLAGSIIGMIDALVRLIRGRFPRCDSAHETSVAPAGPAMRRSVESPGKSRTPTRRPRRPRRTTTRLSQPGQVAGACRMPPHPLHHHRSRRSPIRLVATSRPSSSAAS